MLEHLEERDAGRRIKAAMIRVLEEGSIRTRDLGGSSTTTAFTEAIVREVERA